MLQRPAESEPLGRRRSTAGMSLIEVLVAAALTLVLAVGAAEMMTLALRAKRRGDLAAAISHAASGRLEELKSHPFDDPILAPGDYAATLRVEPAGCLIVETWHITEDGERLKRIRFTAHEAGREGPETVTVLVISRDLGFRP
jgi:type II secretory pathway pseudopilin PulG